MGKLDTGQTIRVSVPSSNVGGFGAWADSWEPPVSETGRYVAFTTLAPFDDLDQNGVEEIYVHDTVSGQTRRVSAPSGNVAGFGEWAPSREPSISDDGMFVAFTTAAPFDSNDTNGVDDVYVHDIRSGETTRASVPSNNVGGFGALEDSSRPSISGEGQFVAFATLSPFDNSDQNGRWDVYVRDRDTGSTERYSVPTSNVGGFGDWQDSNEPSISGDGCRVAFTTDSPFEGIDTNDEPDVYLRRP